MSFLFSPPEKRRKTAFWGSTGFFQFLEAAQYILKSVSSTNITISKTPVNATTSALDTSTGPRKHNPICFFVGGSSTPRPKLFE